tara:strand:- start:55 stop:558 length:504 start_codon:yes stop_codon:yes gene_type:complete
MKIYKNILNEDLLNHCTQELVMLSKERTWGSSFLGWNQDLLAGISGSTLMTFVTPTTKESIIKCISKHFPDDIEYNMQYYIWQYNSGIACHSDECYESGATIYLNDWNMNFGGLFVWRDDSSDIMKAIAPQKNMMILNDKKQDHFVTSISPLSQDFRITIQIWTIQK